MYQKNLKAECFDNIQTLEMETMFRREKPLSSGVDRMVMDDTRGGSLLGECTGLETTEPLPIIFNFEAEEESHSYVTSEEEEDEDQDVEPTKVVVRFDYDDEEMEMDQNPDYSRAYNRVGVYANTDYEARCIFLERLKKVREEIQNLCDYYVYEKNNEVKRRIRANVCELFGQEDTIKSFLKDLTMDGDVESNPGPPKRDARGNAAPRKEWKPRGGSGTRDSRGIVGVAASMTKTMDEIKGSLDALKEIKKDPIVPKKEEEKMPVYHADCHTKDVMKAKLNFDLHDFDMGFGILLVHKILLWLWTLCFLCYLFQKDKLVSFITIILEIIGWPLALVYVTDLCLWLVLTSGVLLAVYFLLRKHFLLLQEARSVVEKWRLVETITSISINPIDLDGRADGISMGALKHFDPIFATVEVETYDYTYGFFRKEQKMVSLELLAQILIPANIKLTADDKTVFAKMQQTVSTLNSLNYNKYLAVSCEYVPQNTLVLAFAMFRHMKEGLRHQNFPRWGMDSP